MTDLSLHFAPNAPWPWLLLLSLGVLGLAWWAYRFAIPPLPAAARRVLPALRFVGLALLLWLLAQPVLERAAGAGGTRLVALVDRSASMGMPVRPGGPPRAQAADRALETLRGAWRGRASIETMPFAERLAPDSARALAGVSTALGDALAELATRPAGQRAAGVVVVSDGAVNAGEDPVAAGRALGLPVHTVLIGEPGGADRRITGVDASPHARAGQATPVRVRFESREPRGGAVDVRLFDGAREIARTRVVTPGPGIESTAEFRVTPVRPGLAVWTARVDSMPAEVSAANNAKQVAIEVAPGRLGVLIVSAGLNWDLTFVRRALAADSSLDVTTRVRGADGWSTVERRGGAGAPDAASLRGRAVVVLDGLASHEVGADFDRALAAFVRGGGGLLVLGGPQPGLARLSGGAFAQDLAFPLQATAFPRGAQPTPAPDGRELLAWDDDPARGERAWRSAAPLGDVTPLRPTAGDRVMLGSMGDGPPLLLVRRIGRGQALCVNGTGVWRWSLASTDELAAERGRRLWRRVVRWLAEPVQGEPLRVRPERWLFAGGERVRLFATLQDAEFRPVAGATIEAELLAEGARPRRVRFEPRAAGSYVAELDGLPAARYRVSARATRGSELGRASAEFAIDRWSLEMTQTLPDSATLAALAAATGGRFAAGDDVARWARGLETRALARGHGETVRLWESPWLFALVVGALGVEWAWRRRRGLP